MLVAKTHKLSYNKVQVIIMRVVIVDDDIVFVHKMKQMIENAFKEVDCRGSIDTFSDPLKVLNSECEYDMAFLDIQMGSTDGLSLARRLKDYNSDIILFFVTAYDGYLDDAMDIEAFRYLTKPVDYNRLKDSVEKAMKRIQLSVITFKNDHNSSYTVIKPNEIEYVEAKGRHTLVQMKNGVFISVNPFKFWKEKLLAYPSFYLVHGSYIINLNRITDINIDSVILDKQFIVPISYRKRAEFRAFIIKYMAG